MSKIERLRKLMAEILIERYGCLVKDPNFINANALLDQLEQELGNLETLRKNQKVLESKLFDAMLENSKS